MGHIYYGPSHDPSANGSAISFAPFLIKDLNDDGLPDPLPLKDIT